MTSGSSLAPPPDGRLREIDTVDPGAVRERQAGDLETFSVIEAVGDP